MTSAEYQKLSLTTDLKDYSPITDRLANDKGLMRISHAAMGMSGEAGEVLDYIKKCVMYGKPLDKEVVKTELGDLLWYMSIMLDQLGSNYEEVMQMNINKLKRRYPLGFSEAAAIERKDVVETVHEFPDGTTMYAK